MRRRLENLGEITGGQWNKSNSYCPKCKATGKSAHELGCDGEKIEISPTARFPRKNANKKIWDDFYKKFVLQEDLKEWKEENK